MEDHNRLIRQGKQGLFWTVSTLSRPGERAGAKRRDACVCNCANAAYIGHNEAASLAVSLPGSGRQRSDMSEHDPYASMHATTIITVRKDGKVVMAGDGQVSLGQTVMKGNARKVRRLAKGDVIAGFAGATADAFTLLERLEAKLEQYPDQLMRAAVELAKDWRTDRYMSGIDSFMVLVYLLV